MKPIPSPSILNVVLTLNRFFRTKTIFVFIIFASFIFSNKANAVVVVIEGGSSFVCPKAPIPTQQKRMKRHSEIKFLLVASSGDLFVEYDTENNQLGKSFDGESQAQNSKPSIVIFKVDIFDRTEKLVVTGKSIENKVYLDTKGLQPGTYFLHIYSGDQVLREQIIIEN